MAPRLQIPGRVHQALLELEMFLGELNQCLQLRCTAFMFGRIVQRFDHGLAKQKKLPVLLVDLWMA
jgi:hypothetical protein